MISFHTRLQKTATSAFTAGSRTDIFTLVSTALTTVFPRAFIPLPTGTVATLKTTPHWLEQCSRVASVGEKDDGDKHRMPWSNTSVVSGNETKESSEVVKEPTGAQPSSRHPEKEDVDDSSCRSSNTNNPNRTIYSRHHDLVKHILRLKARRGYRSTCGEIVVLGVDTLRSICSLQSKYPWAEKAAGNVEGTDGVVPWKPEASLLLTDNPALACNPGSMGLHVAQTRLTTSTIMKVVLERKQPAYTAIPKAVQTPQKLDFAPSTTQIQAAAIFPQPQPTKDFVRPRFVLALDRLRYVWNVGILLRCASAMGVDALFFVEGTADPFNWKTLEISRCLHCHLPYRWGNSLELLKMCEKHNLAPIVADLRGDPIETLRDRMGHHEGICCILGSESHGPSQNILRHAIKVALPMAAYVDSLNVGVAGGIILSALRSLVQKTADQMKPHRT